VVVLNGEHSHHRFERLLDRDEVHTPNLARSASLLDGQTSFHGPSYTSV
jgi:hypothetical protein